jgi:hypothetical protein
MEFVKDYIGHIEKPQVFLCIMKIKDAPIARDLFQWKVYTKNKLLGIVNVVIHQLDIHHIQDVNH